MIHQTSLLGFAFSRDFLGVYVGARAVATGQGQQLYDPQTQRSVMDASIWPIRHSTLMPFIYPAYVAVLLRPLGQMDYGHAFLGWSFINLAATVWTALRLALLFARTARGRLSIVAMFAAWVPLQLTFFHGQLGVLPTLGIVEALVAVRSGHDWRAGWYLSLGLLKPQLIVFPLLVMALWRCWRTVLAFSIAAAITLSVSFATVGFWIPRYIRFLADANRLGAQFSIYPVAMQNWRGLVYSLLKADDGLAAHAALLALTIGSLLVVLYLCGLSSDHRSSHPDVASGGRRRDAVYATAIGLGLLSSPHLYLHDWILAFPAGLMLWSFAREAYCDAGAPSRRSALLLWLLTMAPTVCFVAQFTRWIVPEPIQLVPAYAAVTLAVAVASLSTPGKSLTVPASMLDSIR